MLVSILHRMCGVGLATVGVFAFVWWLVALASGPEGYAVFHNYVVRAPEGNGLATVTTVLGKLAAIGLTWAFFQHMANGLRHFVLDTGAGYELKTNKTGAVVAMGSALVLTVIVWAYIFAKGM